MSVQDILEKKGNRIVVMRSSVTLGDVVEVLAKQHIGTVMMTDSEGQLVGILSERDVIGAVHLHGDKARDIPAEELMQKSVISCTPDMPIESVLDLMSANTIRHLPVVRDGKILGLVSVRDVMDMQREMLLADAERRKQAQEDVQQAKDELQRAYDGLENRILERTEELQKEVIEREEVEDELRLSNESLHERINELQEVKVKLERQGENLVRMSDELRTARDCAEAANKSKSELLAHMSHELRTPLVGIIGFSEIMEDELLGPMGNKRYHEYASDISQAGQHLLALINNLLSLSKIESGKEELLEAEMDVGDAIASTIRLLQTHIDENGITLDCDVQPQAPWLLADEGKVKRVLINLLGNAIKFTDEGGKVSIKAWASTESGYVIQVADTGIGIAPEDIPKALAQFGQVDGESNRTYEGTGLGLPLAKSLMELHGGVLDLQSEVGVGTTVTIRFPSRRLCSAALTDIPAVASRS